MIELGVPFSDPMADGPTIQASSQRALANGVTLGDVLAIGAEVSFERFETPIVLFGYLNPICCNSAFERFRDDATVMRESMAFLVTDIVDDEAAEIERSFRRK